MRCENCGWDNPEGNVRCEKCNVPLNNSMDSPREGGVYNYTAFEGSGKLAEATGNIGKTLRESEALKNEEPPVTCPKCNYRIRANEKSCPNCGEPLGREPLESKNSDDIPKEAKKVNRDSPAWPNKNKTVSPWALIQNDTNTCSLTLLAAENEKTEATPIDFTGKEIILKRDNTEPGNLTITSKEQAALLYEDDKWFIEDRSEMKTTFIHVSEKKELKNGDIIILGNRRFIFNA
jgi:ssDNA-binding Zn-finger/Zn-ribbon topoisomerase 1